MAGKHRRPRLVVLALSLVALACVWAPGPASAVQFVPHVDDGTFEGTSNPGAEIRDVAVDQVSGAVYTVAPTEGVLKLSKFDAQGNPSPFTDPSLGGATSITVWSGELDGHPRVAVDNSTGPTQGRIYVTNKAQATATHTFAFAPSGAPVGGKFPIEAGGTLLAVDPTTGNSWQSNVALIGHISKFLPDGTETNTNLILTTEEEPGENIGLDIGAQGYVYVFSGHYVWKLTQGGTILEKTPWPVEAYSGTLATNQVNGNVIYVPGYFEGTGYELDEAGDELPTFGVEVYESTTLAINGQNGYVYVANGRDNKVRKYKPGPTVTLPDLAPGAPSNIGPNSLQLNATVNPNGVETTKCFFEYGPTFKYGNTTPCTQGGQLTGSAPVPVSASPTGLRKGAIVHYRLVVENSEAAPNNVIKSKDLTARPSSPPSVGVPWVTDVHADSADFHDEIVPEGAPTTYHILYGTADCETESGACTASAETASIGVGLQPLLPVSELTGLQAGTTYHYIFVVTNQSGTVDSAQQIFTTFPFNPDFEDNCPNSHVRQQTGAAFLPDCRAYELASASNQNGYDVESYLVGGQTPFGGYPGASGKVLYAVHNGALPGTGNPTNHGLDPYVATRGESGWTTKYVGIPANDPYSEESFGSPLLATDSMLNTFAFGGEGLCSPCFGDGSTGIPVTLPNGSLVQGMAGPSNPSPESEPELLAEKPLSADGTHLIFGSTEPFTPGASEPTIYDRNLGTGQTYAVSNLPGGGPIECLSECPGDGLAELDISADGSHVVIGQLLDVDAAGNEYWHLYMSVDDSRTIDLTPGTTEGVLYDGMTSDGSRAYFTSLEQMTGEDGDESTDIYRADVGASAATLTLVSVGGGQGDSDECEPPGNSIDEFWNNAEGEESCDVVAVSGGGGVAAHEGSIYFLSPELLDGTAEPADGTENAPNLYVAKPGAAPRYVTTLESSLTGPTPPLVGHKPTFTFAHTQNPKFIAVDNSSSLSAGDVYIADATENVVRKYDPEGNLITTWGNAGVISEAEGSALPPLSGVAVGPDGTLYVADRRQFNGDPNILKFDPEGLLVGSVSLDQQPQPIGISVDNAGRIYYEGYYDWIQRYTPGKGNTVLSTGEYESGIKTGLAVDPVSGDLYVGFGGESIGRYEFDAEEHVIEPTGAPCTSSCQPTEMFGAEEVTGGRQMAVDPTNGDLYVNVGNELVRFFANGHPAPGPGTGAGVLTNSNGVAVGAGAVYANYAGSSGAGVQAFGPLVLASDPAVDSPIVVHGVNDSSTRYTSDFQVTPSGRFTALPTTIPYSGFNNAGYEEIFRYDSSNGAFVCASCNPAGAKGTGAAEMARDGLSLVEDGRVFFNSNEPLVPRDLDNREDAYEWTNGQINLISTGISPFNSSLLSAGADGADAFFFTRDVLAPQDNNGSLVKVYDARAYGGFVYTPPPVTCKASDECHGAASQPGPSPGVNTITGSRGNAGEKASITCKKGHVKSHGKCVKKKGKRKSKKHHRRAKRSGAHKGGANR